MPELFALAATQFAVFCLSRTRSDRRRPRRAGANGHRALALASASAAFVGFSLEEGPQVAALLTLVAGMASAMLHALIAPFLPLRLPSIVSGARVEDET